MINGGALKLHKTEHKKGRKHDYDAYKHNHPTTPLQVENVFDLGYKGVQNDYPTVKSVLPFRKKRKNWALKKKRDTIESIQLRIMVEHTICIIKKFGIMGIKFGNKLRRYYNVSSIVVSGLVNVRIIQLTGMSI
jgi:hypothetical protein